MKYLFRLFAFILISFSNCKEAPKEATTSEAQVSRTYEWITLFDGTSTEGWRGFNARTLPPNWIIEEGTLKSLGSGGDLGGDIVYGYREFDNFELVMEWKISTGGNSGVFYHAQEGDQYGSPYETAPEYQLIDDLGYPGNLEDWQKVGADYAMHVGDPATKPVKPAGEWNSTKIIYTPSNAEHWLNGVKLFSFVPNSEDWKKRRNSGKWDDFPDYAKVKKGLIGLQDHGSFIWFRDIKIKPL